MSVDLISSWARSVLLSMESLGHDAVGLLEEVRKEVGAGARGRLSWDELVLVFELGLARLGPQRMEQLLQHTAMHHSAVRSATELLGSPRMTYLVLFEALAAAQAMVIVQARPTPAGIALKLELNKSLRPSRPLFQCARWFLAALPRARGLPDAKLQGERLTDRELECLIIPPPAPALQLPQVEANARAVAQELFRSPPTPAQPRREPGEPLSTQALQLHFSLTRAEARVVKLLCQGHSMKAIAQDLSVSLETARTHAKRAMQKTDTHRQAELVSLVLAGSPRSTG